MVQAIQPQQEEKKQEQEKKERLPVLEGILQYASDHVLLVGRPGSGKSTALKRLLLEEAKKALSNEKAKIPVLVELRFIENSVEELIKNFFKENDLVLTPTEIENLLDEKRLLLLIDGVNELPSEEAPRKLVAFRKAHKATPMIFTTRDVSLGGNLEIDKLLEMQPLTEKQMRNFVLAYLPEQGEQMLRQLGDRLREFGQTPLLLWMLCELFRQTVNVPSNLGLVFKEFTKVYEENLKKYVPVSKDCRRWGSQLLQHLAFVMIQGEKPTDFRVAIPKQEAEKVLSQFLQGKAPYADDLALRCLDDLLKYHLIQIGSGNQIEFRHQLFQEYYAAEALLKRLPLLSDEEWKRDYLNYLKWTEPLSLMLALVEQEAKALLLVKLSLEVDLKLGAKMAGSVKQEYQQQAINTLLEYVQKLTDLLAVPPDRSSSIDGKPDEKPVKISLLGRTNSARAIPALCKLLDCPYMGFVQNPAIGVLAKLGTEKALEVLLQISQNSSLDRSLQDSAVLGIREIRLESSIPTLIKALDPTNPLTVRDSAAYALGEMRAEQAVPKLIQTLDKDGDIRWRVATALGEIGTRTAVNALLQAFYKDRNKFQDVINVVREVRAEEAVPELIKALSEDSEIQLSAAHALGKIGTQMVIEALQQVLKDKDASVRRIAVGILEEIGNESAVAILRQILEDGDFFVREKANSALKRIPIRVAGTVLRKALKKGDPSVRRKITRILEDAHNGGSVADSSEILQHVDSFSNLATASKAMSIEEAIATLQQALKDPDPSIHECAREVVSDIANPLLNDLSVAIATLESNIDYVDNAATALQNFGDPEMLPHLSNISLFSAIAGSDVIFDVISGIQNRCGFYNYKIVQSSLLEKEKKPESLVDILKEIRQTLENASKAPKYDFRYANINNLSDTFSGVWNEYNYNQEQKRDLAVLVAEIQELFKKMVQNYLTITEDEKPAIVVHLVEKLDILVNSINKFEE